MQQLIDQYKSLIVQIATPYSIGTGFYLPAYHLIITNDHLVRDNRKVVVDGAAFSRQMTKVLYSHPAFDLAILDAPKSDHDWTIELELDLEVEKGKRVLSIGHPFSAPYDSAEGMVLLAHEDTTEISYLHHNAILSPVYNGSLLLTEAGKVLGVNTFVVQEEGYQGTAIPARYLKEMLDTYLSEEEKIGQQCFSCNAAVFESMLKKESCPNCGSRMYMPSQAEEYQPAGVANTIESMLSESGYEVNLSRRGPNNWQIRQGSARINISYYEKTGLIIGDAFLCSLPSENVHSLYEYILKQNYQIDNLTFSIKGQDIVLSLLIFDRYLNLDTGMKLFAHLFERADHFDNILVEEFGAKWKNEED